MANDLKQAIREEYIKCAASPAYFMKKYCYIQHPKRGRIQFNLYPFQERVLTLFQENSYSIVLKSRQLGISTLSAGYSLWLMMFHQDKNILCIATKQDTAKNMVTKVKFMYDNLPSWLKFPTKPDEANKLTLRLPNGSQIKATSASSDAGRSEAVSLLIIDEAAFIHSIGEIWASAQQTLATGGGCIALSTPYGTGNWFHKNWVAAEQADVIKSKFVPIRLPW
jgi:phage FluMu gp28-like protein